MSSGVFENSKLSLHPIAEPVTDSIVFIGLGILATSCLTTWVNHPISNGGLVCASLLNATAIQLAKKMLTKPNNSSYFKIASTIVALGITTISLPYLAMPFVHQLGVITGKAAFQIGLIHLSVKVGIYILLFFGSTNSDKIDTSEIENFVLSRSPEAIEKYSKKEATIAHTKLLSGETFLENVSPNLTIYNAYFTLFQKYSLPVNPPKSIQEINEHQFGILVFYGSYYLFNEEAWLSLPLIMQFSFKQCFEHHGELYLLPLFLFPNNKNEIAIASEEIITSIHHTTSIQKGYWDKLKFKPELNEAFKKYGLRSKN